MAERRRWFIDNNDDLRTFLMCEPRGHAAMSGSILQPPTRPDADFGVLFIEVSGLLPMCGHGTIGTATVLVETGMVPVVEPVTTIRLDTPAGLVVAEAQCREGRCERVTLDFVPSFVEHPDHPLEVEGLGTLLVDVAYGGDYFCLVDAAACGFAVRPDEVPDMVAQGARIERAAKEQVSVRHPAIPELRELGFVMFCARPAASGDPLRNGNVMFPGRLDRSPCGTGSAARLAAMHARGEIAVGQTVAMRSAIDSEFQATVAGVTTVAGRPAILPRISGRAWIYGISQLGVDPADPYPLGFTLPDLWGPGAA
jgi:proline racemase